MGNVDIYGVGTENVYQIVQTGITECLVGVLPEGLNREILASHSCLHPILTLRNLVMCKAHASLRRMLSRELPVRTLLVSIA